MVFSSLVFVFAFLPLTVILYYMSGKRFQNAVLLGASLLFYAWGEPRYVLFICVSILFNYLAGIALGLCFQQYKKKIILFAAIMINAGFLAYFKYMGFLLNALVSLTGLHFSIAVPPLPIGISFYTFQAMSYVIDVYKGKVQPQKKLSLFALYIAMFPQLVAGPIVNYGDIEKQLPGRDISYRAFISGLQRFIYGLAKKVLLANAIGALWITIKSTPPLDMTFFLAWIGICAFALQIYFDFSGYSDMAIGLGNLFGFDFNKNFDYPYTSRSITEFWQRWHISLGAWFREYVYIPLGGNRHGGLNQMGSLIAVWILTGLWHGASWNFVLWGLYYGILIIAEKRFLLQKLKSCPRVVQHIYCLFFMVTGWVFFEFTVLSDRKDYFLSMFNLKGIFIINSWTVSVVKENAVLFLICIFAAVPLPERLAAAIDLRQPAFYRILANACCCFLLLLSTAYLVASTFNPFIYFRF